MVEDEFSDNNDQQPSTDGLGQKPGEKLLRSSVGNLTQELAQLLAASIAQNQANKDRSGTPTNAELINLANGVLAAAAQRTFEPAKDGLLSLSYVQQQPAVFSPLDFGHSDEPIPIPSTLHLPSRDENDHWLRHQMGSAVVGLIAGLMIVIPTVLWLSGFFGPQRSGLSVARTSSPTIERIPSADAKVATVQARSVDQNQRPTAEESSENAAQVVIGGLEPKRAQPFEANPTPPQVHPVLPAARFVDPNKDRIEELLAQTSRRIENGDVISAREILADADDGTQGAISFALAETYDPNMLAAWGIRTAVADAAKARELYEKASELGVVRAQNRLDALR
jgi:hypothetical protein